MVEIPSSLTDSPEFTAHPLPLNEGATATSYKTIDPVHFPQYWEKMVTVLSSELDTALVSAWIKPLKVSEIKVDGEPAAPVLDISLIAPNKFSAEHVREYYAERIQGTLSKICDFPTVKITFRSEQSRPRSMQSTGDILISSRAGAAIARKVVVEEAPKESAPRKARASGRQLDSTLNSKYNFASFVVGGCNQFAHAVALQVAENPGVQFNPLFLYGGAGLGKTHLVNAIGNAAQRRGKTVQMVSSEAFVNELITSIRANRMQQFKTKFRSLDVLIIDDVQFLIGKERTQEEFFHTFNDLYHRRRQIILTSDKGPQELTGLEERLKTRFNSGLSADLQLPDFETRVAILTKKAEANKVLLPSAVAELLAERIATNVRELEGALNRLLAFSSVKKVPISLELAEEAIKGVAPELKQDISVEFIQRSVGERYGVSLSDLLGKRRTQNIALARHIAMYCCRRLTPCSFPEIGALFGGRDHSTVIHACKLIEDRVTQDKNFRDDFELLVKRIKSA